MINSFFYSSSEELFCDDFALKDLAKEYGTPLFVYSSKVILDNIKKLNKSLKEIEIDIHYALKANSTLGIVSLIGKEGLGADIVSGGELKRALKGGVPTNKIVFSGVGKTNEEIILALSKNIKQINVESESELEKIISISKAMNIRAPVALRINPDIKAQTHEKIATGSNQAKFGLPLNQTIELYKKICKEESLIPKGLAVHIGSQIFNNFEFQSAYEFLLNTANNIRRDGLSINNLDLGGGIGVNYSNSKIDFDGFGKIIQSVFKGYDYKLSIEPGRSIVATSGILLTKVIYSKKINKKNFVVVDAAMNDFIRPTLYDAYHPIIPAKKNNNKEIICDVVGPICETGDFFIKNTKLNKPNNDDLLAICNTGAYGSVMSSNYNSRPPANEVIIFKEKSFLIKKSQSIEEQISKEILL